MWWASVSWQKWYFPGRNYFKVAAKMRKEGNLCLSIRMKQVRCEEWSVMLKDRGNSNQSGSRNQLWLTSVSRQKWHFPGRNYFKAAAKRRKEGSAPPLRTYETRATKGVTAVTPDDCSLSALRKATQIKDLRRRRQERRRRALMNCAGRT